MHTHSMCTPSAPRAPLEQGVTELVSRHVATAELLSEAGGELSFRLPFDAVASFGGLLRELDTHGAAPTLLPRAPTLQPRARKLQPRAPKLQPLAPKLQPRAPRR